MSLNTAFQSSYVAPKPKTDSKRITIYLYYKAYICGQGLNSMETGDKSDGKKAFCVHFSPQEEVTFQVVNTEVVFSKHNK